MYIGKKKQRKGGRKKREMNQSSHWKMVVGVLMEKIFLNSIFALFQSLAVPTDLETQDDVQAH